MEDQVKENVEAQNEDFKIFEHDDGFVKIKDEIIQNLSTCKAFIAPILSYKDDGKVSLVTYGGAVPKGMVEVFQQFVQNAFIQFSQMVQAQQKMPDQEDEVEPVHQETEELVVLEEDGEKSGS